MPQVSIITPTVNRQNLLPALWEYVCSQTVQDFEWLVHDSSPTSGRAVHRVRRRARYLRTRVTGDECRRETELSMCYGEWRCNRAIRRR